MVVCVECLPADKPWDVVSVTRRSSGVAPRACVRVYARVLVPPNLYMHTTRQVHRFPAREPRAGVPPPCVSFLVDDSSRLASPRIVLACSSSLESGCWSSPSLSSESPSAVVGTAMLGRGPSRPLPPSTSEERRSSEEATPPLPLCRREEGSHKLAFTRYCFTSTLYCGSRSSFYCPPPAKPTLL